MLKTKNLLLKTIILIAALISTLALVSENSVAAPTVKLEREVGTPTPKPTVSAPVRQIPRTPSASRSHAKRIVLVSGWNLKQWTCLNRLWTHESNFRPNAYNKEKVGGRNAGGIPQLLGLDPKSSVKHQIKVGLKYIVHRYETPCGAWSAWKSRATYYDGDWHGGWY